MKRREKNCIAGIEKPSKGEICFINNGKIESIGGKKPEKITFLGIARTFQIPVLFSTISIYDNIRMGAHFGAPKDKREKERINEVIDFVGLRGKEKIIAEHVDLFDKRLTMLGAALATQPRLLLVDEPTGGLSPREVSASVELFQKINQELGITIIIIEHLMKVLVSVSNRLMILNNGEEFCIGPPQEVIQNKDVIEIYLGD